MSDFTAPISQPSDPLQKLRSLTVDAFIQSVDEGSLFKLAIVALFQILAWGWLVGGTLVSVGALFGDSGYFEQAVKRSEGVEVVGAIIGLLAGFAGSVLASWMLFSVIRHRGGELKASSYDGMLDFILRKAMPRIISTWGEVMFLLASLAGGLKLLSALLGSYVFFPFGAAMREMGGSASRNILHALGGATYLHSRYNNLGEEIVAAGALLFVGFMLLVGAYLGRELWVYFMKLMAAFVLFLPRFAIPLRIRHRAEEPSDQARPGAA